MKTVPLPRFASHWAFFLAIAIIHIYLGGGHLLEIFRGDIRWTHVWKGFGAVLGAYYFVALAQRRQRR